MWKASNFHISINRNELLHRNCTHYINNDLPWMSSRGLIWSTSKSLGFFLLITAEQALSRFSLFKSAFNVSLMLDVPPVEDCDLPRWGATQRAALWFEVAQWGTQRSCSVPVLASLGGGHWAATSPAAHASGPWGHWVQQCPLKHGASWLGCEPPATGESAGLCPGARFSRSGALKKDLSNFKPVPSHISSSYLKNGLYLFLGV